jgi:hypothetical protein
MSITAIRLRAEGDLLVLQVLEATENNYYGRDSIALWRDAKVEDLLDAAPFMQDRRQEVQMLAQQCQRLSAQLGPQDGHP